jgi:uncharacterized protein (TIGR02588 family)
MPRASSTAPPADALELAATWTSVVLIAALIAFLVWDAFQPSRPAAFEATTEAASTRGGQLYVPVAVRNVGDEAARMVQVRVSGPGGAEGRFTIEWLPGRSTRRGVAVLPSDAVGTPLKAQVEGYSEP